MGSVEQRAEMLANMVEAAFLSSDPASRPAAIAAIAAALREQPEARGVVDDAIVERVARALAANDRPHRDPSEWWAGLDEEVRNIHRRRARVSITAAQQPGQEGGGDVWRCFHCDEVFADPAAAADHFGTKIRHDPACTIDPAEFRRLQDRESDYAEEDAACHRAMRGMETQHRLALQREEIKGYERGLRDSGKCPCAAPPSAPVGDFEDWLDRDWPLWRNNPDNPIIARLRRAWDAALTPNAATQTGETT